jgi:type IV pilus assembly protein PilM
MALFGRKRTTVALDIGSGLIKLVVIDHGSGEPVLTKVAFTSVVDGAIVEGEVMDPASSPTPCGASCPPPASRPRRS